MKSPSNVVAFASSALAFALWAAPANADWMAEYSAPTGSTVSSSLFSFPGSGNEEYFPDNNEIALAGGDLFVANTYTNTIGEYTTSGATVNAALLSGADGLNNPYAFASVPDSIDSYGGTDFYILNANGTVGWYNTNAGDYTTLISGLPTEIANSIAVSADDSVLYITQFNFSNPFQSSVAEYDVYGDPINTSLITGLPGPLGIAVSGSELFTANYWNGTISEYTTSGSLVSASLIGHIDDPIAITISGSDMFIVYDGGARIGEWTLAGVPVNPTIYATNGPVFSDGIAVSGSNVFSSEYLVGPEPSTFVMLGLGAVALLVHGFRRRRAQ